jgi:Cu-Zn family superoxide dismutase
MKALVSAVAFSVSLVYPLADRLTAQLPSSVVTLKDTAAQPVGTATLSPADGGGVSIVLDVRGLPPGEHALHFHEAAKCEPPSFESAGEHFNPDGKRHGLRNPQGPHAGDMDNFPVEAGGMAKVMIINRQVTLTPGKASVLAAGGTALIIHAKPDDLVTDPAGNAGDRIACGLVAQ